MKQRLARFLLLALLVCALASCIRTDPTDPVAIADALVNGEGYRNVSFLVSNEEIIGLEPYTGFHHRGAYCILRIGEDRGGGDRGFFLFFKDVERAKDTEFEIGELMEQADGGSDFVFRRFDGMVFVGSADILRDAGLAEK